MKKERLVYGQIDSDGEVVRLCPRIDGITNYDTEGLPIAVFKFSHFSTLTRRTRSTVRLSGKSKTLPTADE